MMSYHGPSLARETRMGICRYCGRGAGWFRTSHRACRDAHRSGLARMVDLAARAAERPEFTQRRVMQILARLAQECYVPDDDLPAVLAAGWHLSPMNRTVDHVPTRAETDWLPGTQRGPDCRGPGPRGTSLADRGSGCCAGDAQPAAATGAALEVVGAIRPHRRCWPHATVESVGTGGAAAAGRHGHRSGPGGRPAALRSPLRPGRRSAGSPRDAAPVHPGNDHRGVGRWPDTPSHDLSSWTLRICKRRKQRNL